MADTAEANKLALATKFPTVQVNLTRLLVTKGLFDTSKECGTHEDASSERPAAGKSITPPNVSPASDKSSAAAAKPVRPNKGLDRRGANLSKLLVTKGLFDENKGTEITPGGNTTIMSDTVRTVSTSEGRSPKEGVRQPEVRQSEQSPGLLDGHVPQHSEIKKRPVDAMNSRMGSHSMHKSGLRKPPPKESAVARLAANLKMTSANEVLKAVASSTRVNEDGAKNPQFASLNFKIPKKMNTSPEIVPMHSREELEAKRQERRRDITNESCLKLARRTADRSGVAGELGRPPRNAKEGQNLLNTVDYTGKRKRNRPANRESLSLERETRHVFSDVVVLDSTMPAPSAAAMTTIAMPTVTRTLFDGVPQHGADSAVAFVDMWLHTNPVGEKPNAAGEVHVPSPVKAVKAKGQVGAAIGGGVGLQPVSQFGVRNLSKFAEDDPVPMIIDTEELVTEVQQFRKHVDFQSRLICGQLTQLRSQMRDEPMYIDGDNFDAPHSRRKKIHLVLDTNVLLSELFLVDELMKGRPGGEGVGGSAGSKVSGMRVVLVVPWVVLQELDGLKSSRRETSASKRTREMASKAVRYLHDLFTNAHPQVRGQTSHEALIDVGFPVECNDDKILQCCLQLKKKGVGKVMLLSNDRNLCSKAIVHSIKAFSKDSIKNALDMVDPLPSSSLNKQVPGVAEEAARERIAQAFKTVLLGVLGDIVKHEMQEIYGDMWLKVVTIRPPWSSALDVLKCIDKHWVAVFGHCVPRRAKVHLDLVIPKMKALTGQPNHDELKYLFGESVKFLSYFEARVPVSVHAKRGMQSIRELLKELSALRSDVPVGDGGGGVAPRPDSQPMVVQPVSSGVAGIQQDEMPQAIFDELSPPGPVVPVDPLVVVYTVFQRVWSSINHICGSIYDSFNLPNPISYVRPSVLPSPEECYNFIPRFYSVITEIRDLLRRILRMPLDVSPKEVEFAKLCHRLLNYYSTLSLSSEHSTMELISPEMLHFFCTTYEKREQLSRGLIQIEECCTYIFRLILTIKDWEI